MQKKPEILIVRLPGFSFNADGGTILPILEIAKWWIWRIPAVF